MKKFFGKGWVQIILFGAIIGAVLIVLDNKFHLWNKKPKSEEEYNGLIGIDKDKVYVTTANYPEMEYDFGKVREGDTVMHEFKIINTGKDPLFIYKAVGSCDCVKVVANTADPIPAGGQQSIKVYFLSKGRKGPQMRTATVDTNTDPSQMIVTLKGEVE